MFTHWKIIVQISVSYSTFAGQPHIHKSLCTSNSPHNQHRTPQGPHLMVCNRSWHLPGDPKLVWHPARLTKEWGCVGLFMDTLHLKYPFVLSGSEGSALTIPLFLLSPIIIMLCHFSLTMTKDHFVCRCAFKHLFIHAFINTN